MKNLQAEWKTTWINHEEIGDKKMFWFSQETEGISGNYRPNGSTQNPGKILAQIIKQMAWECFVIYLFIYLYSASLQEGFAVAYRGTHTIQQDKKI